MGEATEVKVVLHLHMQCLGLLVRFDKTNETIWVTGDAQRNNNLYNRVRGVNGQQLSRFDKIRSATKSKALNRFAEKLSQLVRSRRQSSVPNIMSFRQRGSLGEKISVNIWGHTF